MAYDKYKAAKKKIELCEYKGGVYCSHCGYKKNLSSLSFHHITPEDKLFKISSRECFAYSMDKLKNEADKCEVLCINCHMEYHNSENEKETIPYRKNYRLEQYDNCLVCGDELSGLKKKYCSEICKNNSQMKKESDKRQYTNRRIKRKEFFVNYKGGSCQKCGYNKNISCLIFHHRNPNHKLFPLTVKNLSSKKIEDLKKEVDKCDLLCHNCHNEEHYPDLDLDKLLKLHS
jgi:hypothetical protein